MKKHIIVSGVNLVDGGPLAVLQDCLHYLSINLADEYKVTALVNRKGLFSFKNINYIEFPGSKKSWINRLYYEYYYFSKLAKQLKPFLWLSFHDITPNVTADRLAVYCHNPAPFYKLTFEETVMDPKFTFFNIFYKYLYRINIKKADFVIVQQEWLRHQLIRLVKLKSVIVAHPEVYNEYFSTGTDNKSGKDGNFVFFYPALPRVFKNFEIICKASEILLKQAIHNFQVIFTIAGAENRYSKHIYNSFQHIKNIKFLGIQSRDNVFKLYNKATCLIFPSKLETWGLPISEFKKYDKPILLANLPYAHETLGTYDKVKFFDPDDPGQLAVIMKEVMNGEVVFEKAEASIIPGPFSQNWNELFDILLTRVKE